MADNLTILLYDQPYAPVLRRVGEVAAREGIEAYAVGGVVRDVLLGRATKDIDFVTVGPGSGIRLAKAVGEHLGGRTVHLYENFGTAAIRLPAGRGGGEPLVLEFVAARRESYRRHSRKPLVEEGTLEDDQRRRDFTINAMAVHIIPDRFGDLIDPFEGRADLAQRRLRTPLDPHRTFEDDPLRMIRAARFAAQLGFAVDPPTVVAMRAQASRVEILSRERIIDEVQKMIRAPVPSVGFKLLEETGLLRRFFPELVALKGVEEVDRQRHKDNFYHTLQVLDNLAAMTSDRTGEATEWLRWAALLHDIAKPLTKRFVEGTGWTFHGHEDRGTRMIPKLFRRLKLPMDERMAYVQKLVRLHHRPVALVDEDVTDSAVRRLLFEAGDDIDDLMMLVRADITSKNPRRVQRYLGAFDRVEARMAEVEEKDHLRNFQPPVDGGEIMEVLGIGEGVAVGIIKETIREAILDGKIPNEHDAAYAHMMQIKDEAVRRGALFDEVMGLLRGPERRAVGAIKQEIFQGHIPQDHDAALQHLLDIKARVLAEA
ncbi:MAG: CCA tRNA nucleotidyltransferase [Rhodothermales bacterium]